VHDDVAETGTAYRALIPILGSGAAGVFLVSLLASGLSSSAVGTMAGQLIMQGFVGFRIPLGLRRLVTMVPSFVVVALGIDATQALILSQVVLSLILPLPMIALLTLTLRRDVMGSHANGRLTMAVATAAAIIVLALNLLLILQIAGVPPQLCRSRITLAASPEDGVRLYANALSALHGMVLPSGLGPGRECLEALADLYCARRVQLVDFDILELQYEPQPVVRVPAEREGGDLLLAAIDSTGDTLR
jgi:Natural resistance-associated macrophage protein